MAIYTSGTPSPICLNFGIAAENVGGVCNLRYDDTNPAREDVEYVESIKSDVRWLGFEWGDREFLRLSVLPTALRVRRAAHQGRQGLRLQPESG